MNKFVVMLEWFDSFQELNNEEKGILFQNFYNYHCGLPIDLEHRIIAVLWKCILPDIDRINEAYTKNINNGKKGGAPKGTPPWNKKTKEVEQTQSEPNANPMQSYKEKEKEIQTIKDTNNINTETYLDSLISSKEKKLIEIKKTKIHEPKYETVDVLKDFKLNLFSELNGNI